MILLFCRWELWGGVNVRPPLRPELEPLSPGAAPCVTLTSAATLMGHYLLENSRIDLPFQYQTNVLSQIFFNTKSMFYPSFAFLSSPQDCWKIIYPWPEFSVRKWVRGCGNLFVGPALSVTITPSFVISPGPILPRPHTTGRSLLCQQQI